VQDSAGVLEMKQCTNTPVTKYFMDACHGQKNCNLIASPKAMGAVICSLLYVYLKTVYACVEVSVINEEFVDRERSTAVKSYSYLESDSGIEINVDDKYKFPARNQAEPNLNINIMESEKKKEEAKKTLPEKDKTNDSSVISNNKTPNEIINLSSVNYVMCVRPPPNNFLKYFPERGVRRVQGKGSHNTQPELIVHPRLFFT
jgi:hypothetical protein